EEAHDDVNQKFKEFEELCESFRQYTQTCLSELKESQQFLTKYFENREEKINSLRLSQQKLAYYTRLAGKCVKIWAKSRGSLINHVTGIWPELRILDACISGILMHCLVRHSKILRFLILKLCVLFYFFYNVSLYFSNS
ncbi:hypothetical protein MKW92_015339, partial [Papaver armeniacum]